MKLGVRVRPELRVRVNERNYRVPDVTVIRGDAPFLPIPTEPPLLCIEVLSPDDEKSDLEEKIEDYVRAGVGAIWIVDPRRRRMFTADADGMHAVEEFRLAETGVRITSAELFAELDELEARE